MVPIEIQFRAASGSALTETQKVVDGIKQIANATKGVATESTAAGRTIQEQATANVAAAARQREALQGLAAEYKAIASAAKAGSAEQAAAADLAAVAQRKLGSDIVVTGQASTKAASEHEKHSSSLKNLDKEARGASSGLGILGGSLSRVAAFGSNTFLLGLLGGGIVKSIVDTTRQIQEGQAQLAGELQNIGAGGQTDQVDAFLKKLSALSGFTETDLIPGMTRLLSVTKDVGKAEADASLATDVARKYNLDYSDALRIVSLIEAGRLRGLQQYVGNIVPVTTATDALKNKVAELTAEHIKADPAERLHLEHLAKLSDQSATAAAGMDALRQRTQGADAAFQQTSAGHLADFRVAIENLENDLGKVLIPDIDSLVQWLDKTVERWDKSGAAARDMQTVVGLVKSGISALGTVLPPVWHFLDDIAQTMGGWKIAFEIVIGGLLAKKFFDLGQGIVNDFRTAKGAISDTINMVERLATKMGLIGPAAQTAADETTAANQQIGTSADAAATQEATIGTAAATDATEVTAAATTIEAENAAIAASADTAAGSEAAVGTGLTAGALGKAALVGGAVGLGLGYLQKQFLGTDTTGTVTPGLASVGAHPKWTSIGYGYSIGDLDNGHYAFSDGKKMHEISKAEYDKLLAQSAAAKSQGGAANRGTADALMGRGAATTGPGLGPVVPGGTPLSQLSATHQTGGLSGYPAVDVMARPGTPVLSPENGVITRGGIGALDGHPPSEGNVDPGVNVGGWNLYLKGDSGTSYFFTHLDRIDVRNGQRVTKGQQLAVVASISGIAPHVHVGVDEPGAGIQIGQKYGYPGGTAGGSTATPPTVPTNSGLLGQINALTGTSTVKGKAATFSPISPAGAAAILKAQIAVNEATGVQQQLTAREQLLKVLQQELLAVEAEHETGKDRVKQLQAEKTLTGEIKTDLAAIAKLTGTPAAGLLPAGMQQRLAQAGLGVAQSGSVKAGEDNATLEKQIAARTREIQVINQAITTLKNEEVSGKQRIERLKEEKTLTDQLNQLETQRAKAEKELLQNQTAAQERKRLGLDSSDQPLAPGVASLKKEYQTIIKDTQDYGIQLNAEQKKELENFAWILKQNFIPPDVKAAIKQQMDDLLSSIKDAIQTRKQDIADAMTQLMDNAVQQLQDAEQQALDNLQITVTMPDGTTFQYGGAAGTGTEATAAGQQLAAMQLQDQQMQDQQQLQSAQQQLAQDQQQLAKDMQGTTQEDYQAELAAVKPIIGQMGEALGLGNVESGAMGMAAGGLSEGEAGFLYSELSAASKSAQSKTSTDPAAIAADQQRIAADKQNIEQVKRQIVEQQLQTEATAQEKEAEKQLAEAKKETTQKYEDEIKALKAAMGEVEKWAETHKVTWQTLFGPNGELNRVFKKWHLDMNTLATQVGGDFLANLATALEVSPSTVAGATKTATTTPAGGMPHLQVGGPILRDGPVYAHGGEYVLNPQAVSRIGVPALQAMNSGGPVGPPVSLGGGPVVIELHSADPQADWLASLIDFRVANGPAARTIGRKLAVKMGRRQKENRF